MYAWHAHHKQRRAEIEKRQHVDAALDEAIKTLESTNLRTLLVVRDLCEQLFGAETPGNE